MSAELDVIRRAAGIIRARATMAAKWDTERWMVDQSEDDGLIVGSFVPEDVDAGGVVSSGCIAFFAYPFDEQRRVYAHALPVAAHMAGFDPQAAKAVADWLDAAADAWGSNAVLDQAALAVARAYLREQS